MPSYDYRCPRHPKEHRFNVTMGMAEVGKPIGCPYCAPQGVESICQRVFEPTPARFVGRGFTKWTPTPPVGPPD